MRTPVLDYLHKLEEEKEAKHLSSYLSIQYLNHLHCTPTCDKPLTYEEWLDKTTFNAKYHRKH